MPFNPYLFTLQFYLVIYLVGDFFLIFLAKKIHDVGVYLPNLFKKCLLVLPRIPKKIWCLWAHPPLWGPNPFGGSGAPQRGWAHRPQNFFGNSRECQRTFFKEVGQIDPLHHGFRAIFKTRTQYLGQLASEGGVYYIRQLAHHSCPEELNFSFDTFFSTVSRG